MFESINNQIHSSTVGLKPSEPQSRHDLYPNVPGTFPYMPTYDPQIGPSNISERRGITQESFSVVIQYGQTYQRNDTVIPCQSVFTPQLPPADGGPYSSLDMGVPYYSHVPISSANAPVSSVNMGPAFINQNQSNLNPYTPNIMNMSMVNTLSRQPQPMNFMQPQRPMGNMGPNINPHVYGVQQNMMPPQFYPNMMGPMQNNPPRVSRKPKEPDTFDGRNIEILTGADKYPSLYVPVEINKIKIDMLIDTGSPVTILYENLIITVDLGTSGLSRVESTLSAADGNKMKIKGQAELLNMSIWYPKNRKTNRDKTQGNLPENLKELVEKCSSNLTLENKQKLIERLVEYQDIFVGPDGMLGQTDVVKHKINTGSAKPVKTPTRRISPAQKDIVEKELDSMLKKGIIEPSNSSWSSPICLVKKKVPSFLPVLHRL
ncbi:unnamed protein product [Mytilus coruscus]|uniref:Peptidase A2 domain-containing protein n=1 Tax=Mytilus coruscus TaxID=42192 RepID=A0A6J8D3A1_MYTCO|nr:unnamed protein product [Mytilus coruscus]